MSISENISYIKASLPEEVTLIAVSKFHPADAIKEAYDSGQRIFGESRAQELTAKQKELPSDIEWHFIGSLQTNKVKDIAPFIHTIHSIDSLKLLQEVHKQAARHNRIIHLLLEIHLAEEETKHGLSIDACKELLSRLVLSDYPFIRINGLMCMATDTDDSAQIRKEFHTLYALFQELKSSYFKGSDDFKELSMGMSHDYPIAVKEGSTMIRVGSFIFGDRAY